MRPVFRTNGRHPILLQQAKARCLGPRSANLELPRWAASLARRYESTNALRARRRRSAPRGNHPLRARTLLMSITAGTECARPMTLVHHHQTNSSTNHHPSRISPSTPGFLPLSCAHLPAGPRPPTQPHLHVLAPPCNPSSPSCRPSRAFALDRG